MEETLSIIIPPGDLKVDDSEGEGERAVERVVTADPPTRLDHEKSEAPFGGEGMVGGSHYRFHRVGILRQAT